MGRAATGASRVRVVLALLKTGTVHHDPVFRPSPGQPSLDIRFATQADLNHVQAPFSRCSKSGIAAAARISAPLPTPKPRVFCVVPSFRPHSLTSLFQENHKTATMIIFKVRTCQCCAEACPREYPALICGRQHIPRIFDPFTGHSPLTFAPGHPHRRRDHL